MKTKQILLILSLLLTTQIKSQVLDISELFQEQTGWCWAASCANILNYYNNSISQCEVVEYARINSEIVDFGDVNCCDDPSQGCNRGNAYSKTGGILDILITLGGFEIEFLNRPLTMEEIISDIRENKLFIIIWSNKSKHTQHAMVGHGLVDSLLYFNNPWFEKGLTVANYSWVLENDINVWSFTIRLKSIPNLFPVTITNIEDHLNNIKIYPNPTSNYLMVNIKENIDYHILTLTGQVISNGMLINNKVDVNNLSSGIYVIKFKTKEGFKTIKFVKF